MLSPQNDLSRPSITSDSWGRYYTADWVSETLVRAIQSDRPQTIVELGTGRGALAFAAREKWRLAEVITVDMDKSTSSFLEQLDKPYPGSHKHHIHDALDDDLANRIGVSLGSADVAVCNPPYVRPRWRSGFGRILEEAGLSGALKSIHDAGADLLFIAQNLRLLKQNGKLGLILPDGLITAEKFSGVRSTLLREHLVEQVIQLPRNIFAGTEAQTHLMVLAKKSGETNLVTLRKVNVDGVVSPPVIITSDLAQRRLDYGFHAAAGEQRLNRKGNQPRYIKDVAVSITRGSISSHQIPQCTLPVFHLSDFISNALVVPKRFRLTQRQLQSVPRGMKISMPGDVLVARIGRNLHEKVAIVQHGPSVISDCVFAIRTNHNNQQRLLKFLSSLSGRKALAASSHGVGAQYLTTKDLLELDFTR